MAKDHIIYGKRCRWNRRYYAWVSDTGTLVLASDKDNPFNRTGMKSLYIKTDYSGNKVAAHPYGYEVYIAEAVMECFCPPRPSNGKRYMINHRDGNKLNCYYRNLEWVPYHYTHATTSTVKLSCHKHTLEVGMDGSVKIDKKKASLHYSFFDPDMGLEAVVDPHIRVPREHSIYDDRVYMDDIMKDAGYIQGDDAILSKPVILHRDEDWMNFSSDNLEWVEETDPRYCSYMEKKRKIKHEECIRINPGRDVPDWF